MNPNDTHTLFQYGSHLFECAKYLKAEKYLLRAIIADPAHETAIRYYINILFKTGKHKEHHDFCVQMDSIGYLS